MAEDFVVETTNESGGVEQKRVSVNATELSLANRGLVRIVGLERVTSLRRLYVHRLQSTHFWCRISRIFSSFLVQLEDNCFVDVPVCVLASTQLTGLHVCLVLFRLFLRCRC
jgi:hypothetical protein